MNDRTPVPENGTVINDSDLKIDNDGNVTMNGKPVAFVTSGQAFTSLEGSDDVVPILTKSLEHQCEQGYLARHIMNRLGLKPPKNPYLHRT